MKAWFDHGDEEYWDDETESGYEYMRNSTMEEYEFMTDDRDAGE